LWLNHHSGYSLPYARGVSFVDFLDPVGDVFSSIGGVMPA